MKRIIDGRRYDTETAEEVAEASYLNANNDHRSFHETLYRTPKGSWFLEGVGGPMTRWAEHLEGNTCRSGDGIIPLTPDEALEWLEKEGKTDLMEKFFVERIADA